MIREVILTERDYTLFDDISSFGFTTTDHFVLRFSTSVKQASRRLIKLARNNYLRAIGQTIATRRKLYVPAGRFFKIYPFSEVNRLNIKNIGHDEYVLKLYCLLKLRVPEAEIILEQDIKKGKDSRKFLRIPDLILKYNGGNFVFEYERSSKNGGQYEKILRAYRLEDSNSNYFVFICENEKIAKKIKDNLTLSQISIIKACKFLDLLKSEKYDRPIDYIWDKEVNYF